jgi:hypothetical protein
MKRSVGYFVCTLVVLLALSFGACASNDTAEEDIKISVPDDDLGEPIPAEDLE